MRPVEEANYVDTGCEVHPSCLSCPRRWCIYDVPEQHARAKSRRERDELVRQALANGTPRRQVAREFNVSLRTVDRARETA